MNPNLGILQIACQIWHVPDIAKSTHRLFLQQDLLSSRDDANNVNEYTERGHWCVNNITDDVIMVLHYLIRLVLDLKIINVLTISIKI